MTNVQYKYSIIIPHTGVGSIPFTFTPNLIFFIYCDSTVRIKWPAIFTMKTQFAIWMAPLYEGEPYFLSFDQPVIKLKPDAEADMTDCRNDWLYL